MTADSSEKVASERKLPNMSTKLRIDERRIKNNHFRLFLGNRDVELLVDRFGEMENKIYIWVSGPPKGSGRRVSFDELHNIIKQGLDKLNALDVLNHPEEQMWEY